jgi:hypothetical protein
MTVLMILLASCSQSQAPTTSDAGIAGAITVLLKPKELGNGSNLAAMEGILEVRGKCLVVKETSVIWPADTVLEVGENGEAVIYNKRLGQTVRVGDHIVLGGGFIEEELAEVTKPNWTGLEATGCKAPFFGGSFEKGRIEPPKPYR